MLFFPVAQEPLCLALSTCCKGSRSWERCVQLLTEPMRIASKADGARRMVGLLLDAAAAGQGGGEDLDRLLGQLVWEAGGLGVLVEACE